jgi:proline iminopeptidase
MVPDAGHAFDEPGILDAVVEATDRFAEPAAPRTGEKS